MINISSIVEGDGEVHAVPVLLRRLRDEWSTLPHHVEPLPPIRVHRDRFLNREEEFRKKLLLAAAKCGDQGWILIILDADDDCPVDLANDVYQRAIQHVSHRRVSVIAANREYEAWFIAAAPSLDGKRGFQLPPDTPVIDAETPRDAKGWIGRKMAGGNYSEVLDQPAFTASFSLQMAHDNSRSFRKLCKEWEKNVVSVTLG